MTSPERDLPYQPWLEHSLSVALDPAKDGLRQSRAVGVHAAAVYAAGFALGKLLAWQAHFLQAGPELLHEPMQQGLEAGRKSYKPLVPRQRAA